MRTLQGLMILLVVAGTARAQIKPLALALNCDDVNSGLCTERRENINYEGKYVGHDEPSVLQPPRRPNHPSSRQTGSSLAHWLEEHRWRDVEAAAEFLHLLAVQLPLLLQDQGDNTLAP